MTIINKLIPILEIDLGTRKLFYSSQSFRHSDGSNIRQYDGLLKSEGGISKSLSVFDFKASVSVASNVTVVNKERLQDVFYNNPESFTGAKLAYVYGLDSTQKIDEVVGIASNPNWDKINLSMNIKDSNKLFYKNVPNVIFDEKTFQQSTILADITAYTRRLAVGDPNRPGYLNDGGGNADGAGTKNITLVKFIVSTTLGGKPKNFWKGARLDVIMDQLPSDDTNNASGQFGVVVSSWDTTVFFNDKLDKFLVRDDETAVAVLNNTLSSDTSVFDVTTKTFQIIKNAVPQNADSIGSPVPIIYGAPEKVPMVWSIGQKSTRTNSIGIGDDVYLFASHRCKLGVLPDSTTDMGLSSIGTTYPFTGNDANGAPINTAVISYTSEDIEDIRNGLRTEVYWSLEDKRVIDIKISPGNKNWIPNPFPKRFRGGNTNANSYRDSVVRLISPFHKIRTLFTNRNEVVHAVQLRGGEFNWFDLNTKFELRAQFAMRYGMGNSKLYISTEGIEDDQDGFYTGFYSEYSENQQRTTLIKNPADVLLHFIMNYTSVNENRDLIDIPSFRLARQMLNGWRFDTAITEVMNGEQFVDRLCQQCASVIFMSNGKFKMKTIIPSKLVPKAYLREGEHIVRQKLEFSKTEDIYNDFAFNYKYDYPNKKFSGVIKRNRSNDPLCRRSFAINGFERSRPQINFSDIIDESTAQAMADVYVDIFSKRRVYLDCDLVYNKEVVDANLEIGDCVSITSAQAPNGWTEKKCLVIETRKYADRMEVKLMEI